MRHKIFFIISINFILMSCNEYKKVIKDFGLHSYYIAINVAYDNRIAPIVLENSDFYTLIKGDSLSEKEYVLMLEYLVDKMNPYEIINVELANKLEEYKVDIHGNLFKEYANIKERNLIKIFFDANGVQQKSLNIEQKKIVIYLLFKNKIFVKVDDETGLLYIP